MYNRPCPGLTGSCMASRSAHSMGQAPPACVIVHACCIPSSSSRPLQPPPQLSWLGPGNGPSQLQKLTLFTPTGLADRIPTWVLKYLSCTDSSPPTCSDCGRPGRLLLPMPHVPCHLLAMTDVMPRLRHCGCCSKRGREPPPPPSLHPAGQRPFPALTNPHPPHIARPCRLLPNTLASLTALCLNFCTWDPSRLAAEVHEVLYSSCDSLMQALKHLPALQARRGQRRDWTTSDVHAVRAGSCLTLVLLPVLLQDLRVLGLPCKALSLERLSATLNTTALTRLDLALTGAEAATVKAGLTALGPLSALRELRLDGVLARKQVSCGGGAVLCMLCTLCWRTSRQAFAGRALCCTRCALQAAGRCQGMWGGCSVGGAHGKWG